jgi:hypothetical protein
MRRQDRGLGKLLSSCITVTARGGGRDYAVGFSLGLNPPIEVTVDGDEPINLQLPVDAAGFAELPPAVILDDLCTGRSAALFEAGYQINFQLGPQKKPVPNWLAVDRDRKVNIQDRSYRKFYRRAKRVADYFGIRLQMPPPPSRMQWLSSFLCGIVRQKSTAFDDRASELEELARDVAELKAGCEAVRSTVCTEPSQGLDSAANALCPSAPNQAVRPRQDA